MSYNKETNMYEGYIYVITNNVNNKVYIGQTRETIEERFRKHKSDAFSRDDNMAIHYAIKKYGKNNFQVRLVEKYECTTVEELRTLLNEKEQFYIEEYDSLSPNGYNISHGGNSNGEKSIPIIQYNMELQQYFHYDSIIKAEIKTGIPSNSICACCKGKIFSTQGNIFRYEKDGISEKDIQTYIHLHPRIKKYNCDGQLLEIFANALAGAESVRDKFPNANGSGITSCCRGKLVISYGYIWRYEYDDFNTYNTIRNTRKKSTKKNKKNDNNSTNKKHKIVYIEQRNKNTGKVINIFSSYQEIKDKLGYTNKQISAIRECCRKHSGSCYGYHWCFLGEFDVKNLYKVGSKGVDMYTIDGVYIRHFSKAKDGVNFLGYKDNFTSGITECCSRRVQTAFGYVWRYTGEPFGEKIEKNRNNSPVNIIKYDLQGKYISTYKNTGEISREYNLTLQQVRNFVNRHKVLEKQYVLFYEDEDFDKDNISYDKEQRINQYDLNDNFINMHPNASEAGRKTSCDPSSILKCCKKKYKSIKGFKWYYVNDIDQPDKTKIIT